MGFTRPAINLVRSMAWQHGLCLDYTIDGFWIDGYTASVSNAGKVHSQASRKDPVLRSRHASVCRRISPDFVCLTSFMNAGGFLLMRFRSRCIA